MTTPDNLFHDLDDPQKRLAAILALGEMAYLPALDRILAFVTDPAAQIRRAVMVALATFEGDRVLAAIIGGLHDADADVRAAAETTWAQWVLKNMLQLTGADRGFVMLKNPQTGAMEYRAGEKVEAEQVSKPEFALSQDVIAESARTGETILTDNASQDARFQGAQSIVGYSLRQLVAVPLKSGDEILGVIYADKRLMSGMFQPDDLQHLTRFADQAIASTQQPLPMAGPPPPAPIAPPQAGAPDFDNMTPEEMMLWMESLAKRQGVSDGYSTAADLELAEADPASVVIDEPGYVPSIGLTGKKDGELRPSQPTASQVNFSAYHPAEAIANRQHGLYVYAHLPELARAIADDVGQFRDQLGGIVPEPRVAKQTARLQTGTLVTVTPECDELDFEPAAVTKKWNGQWTRFDFDFQPKSEMVGDTLFVRVSVTVSSVEIAHIKCPIQVVAQPTIQPDNPLLAAKLAMQTAALYQRIFISYSRRDTQVAEAYRLAQMAVGNEVFMDSYSIRVGEDWRAALAKAIDAADVFQLFWSNAAAESENVRDEWDYALKHRCPDQKCATFIRPVFWDKPMPAPPPALSHLNFRFVPLDATAPDA